MPRSIICSRERTHETRYLTYDRRVAVERFSVVMAAKPIDQGLELCASGYAAF